MNRGDLAFSAGPSMTMKLLPAEFTGALLTLAGRKLVTHNFVLVQGLVVAGEHRFPPPNFNLKFVRIQRGGGSWMLLDALLHCWEGSAGPRLKNVM
jgi:hypothetical protein